MTLVGAALIFAGLADVFFTVLHYDGFGFLSSRLYDRLFRLVRLLTHPFPRRWRAIGLSLAAPLMVPATITVWITLVAVGYALIYYAGMRDDSREAFTFSTALEPSFANALYMSGTAVSTLGFGDLTPKGPLYQLLTVSEALIGFGILTLAITYVLGVYSVLQKLSELTAALHHQAHDTADPWTILVPHFPNGEPRDIETPLIELHRSLVSLHEGMRRYPVAYHFHSRRAYRSLPYAFRMAGLMAGALRWGLPKGHPASQAPHLPTLLTGLETIQAYVWERFLTRKLPPAPEPASQERFAEALRSGEEPEDFLLRRFLHMERFMRDLARLEESDPAEAYERYVDWLPFAYRNRAFFEATARDLGYELDELTHTPGQKLF